MFIQVEREDLSNSYYGSTYCLDRPSLLPTPLLYIGLLYESFLRVVVSCFCGEDRVRVPLLHMRLESIFLRNRENPFAE